LQTIEDYQQFDVPEMLSQDHHHTYFRNKNKAISSRIDYILTNFNSDKILYQSVHSIFDHSFVKASLINSDYSNQRTISMKEYILVSPDFMDKFQEGIQEFGMIARNK